MFERDQLADATVPPAQAIAIIETEDLPPVKETQVRKQKRVNK